jgi:hypothetical protein
VSRKLITVAEAPLFMRQVEAVWDNSEREAFVNFIAGDPESGDVIPETGGVRHDRSRSRAFHHACPFRCGSSGPCAARPLYLLMLYAKARREDLTPDEKKAVRKLAAILKGKSK